MIREICSLILPFFLLLPVSAAAPVVEVTSPQQGQVLKGSVMVSGTVAGDGLVSADISYAYDNGDSSTWFIISSISAPVTNGAIAVWDTTTISDGDYQLKILAKYQNGQTQEAVIHQMLVRNYTSAPSTPTPTFTVTPIVSSVSADTPTPTFIIEATPYPTNSGSLEVSHVKSSLEWGGILGLAALLCLGLYALYRWIKYFR